MRCNALPLVHIMLYLLTSYVLHLRAALASTYLGSVSSACELEHTRRRSCEDPCSS